MKSYVISLPSSSERRNTIRSRLQALGLQATVFDAVNGELHPPATRPPRSRALSSGEYGCYLSHLQLWKHVADSEDDYALVFEDDAAPHAHLLQLCYQIISSHLEFDLVRLGSNKKLRGRKVLETEHGALLLPTNNPDGSYAYLISRNGARKLYSLLREPCQPVDWELNFYWQKSLLVLSVWPPAASHDNDLASVIGSVRTSTPARLSLFSRWQRSLSKRWRIRNLAKHVKTARKT